jgi:hypothetical protein
MPRALPSANAWPNIVPFFDKAVKKGFKMNDEGLCGAANAKDASPGVGSRDSGNSKFHLGQKSQPMSDRSNSYVSLTQLPEIGARARADE